MEMLITLILSFVWVVKLGFITQNQLMSFTQHFIFMPPTLYCWLPWGIFYPYPVAISTSISEEQGTVHLKAHCVKSCEFPAFFVNHDNTLAIPGTCDSQFSQEDHALLNMLGQSICPLPAELSITVSCFFQRIKCFWLMDNTSSSPSVVGLVPGCCIYVISYLTWLIKLLQLIYISASCLKKTTNNVMKNGQHFAPKQLSQSKK